jgi:DNA-binding response OmpR family regulator
MNNGGMRVLVVEDDKKTSGFICKALKSEGFAVDLIPNGDDAFVAVLTTPYDAVVLDIMIPGRDGLSLVKQWRARGNTTPVLLLSARSEVSERVAGLNVGADDYLAKPFALPELIARVRVMVRRGAEQRPTSLQVGDLMLDPQTRKAVRAGKSIELTAREFRLLEYLMSSAGRICTRMMILEKVWDYSFDPGSNIVDVYVRKLREKIDTDFEPKLLHSSRGVGYFIKDPS